MKNQKQYTEDCLRTWKPGNTTASYIFFTGELPKAAEMEGQHLEFMANHYEEVAHIIAGISSEILGELEFAFALRDQTNIIEEIGDLQYYVLIAAEKYNTDLTGVHQESGLLFSDAKLAKFCLDSPFKSVKYHAGELINLIKKYEIYKSPKVTVLDISEAIRNLQVAIYRLSLKNGFSPSDAIEKVIAKLKERFKEKFTIEEVSNRDLEAERKALES